MLLDMLPELKDATDIVDVVAYNLGFSRRKPQFKRFNYAEKMEYWALVWGTFVMAATGLTIWFKLLSTEAVPRWVVEVAITVHFYEAILATLAIIVWHFYQVILDPDTYPVNFAFLDGKMSVGALSGRTWTRFRDDQSCDRGERGAGVGSSATRHG